MSAEGLLAKAGTPVGLGFRAGRGGSVVVAVAADGRKPRVVLSTFLATAAEGDRLSLEPYHVAAEMERGPHGEVSSEAAAAVAEGRKRQDQLAAAGLSDILRKLEEAGCKPIVAALLVNRAAGSPTFSNTVSSRRSIRRSPKDSLCATPFGTHSLNAPSKPSNWTRSLCRRSR